MTTDDQVELILAVFLLFGLAAILLDVSARRKHEDAEGCAEKEVLCINCIHFEGKSLTDGTCRNGMKRKGWSPVIGEYWETVSIDSASGDYPNREGKCEKHTMKLGSLIMEKLTRRRF